MAPSVEDLKAPSENKEEAKDEATPPIEPEERTESPSKGVNFSISPAMRVRES